MDAGPRGRGRDLNFTLPLDPMIDLLATCISFLIVTTIWVQVTTLPVDQRISNTCHLSEAPDHDPLPVLTVHLRADGIWLGRALEEIRAPSGRVVVAPGRDLPQIGGVHDWASVRADLEEDHRRLPGATTVVVNADDGTPYADVIAALDLVRGHGYGQVLLAGGPPYPRP